MICATPFFYFLEFFLKLFVEVFRAEIFDVKWREGRRKRDGLGVDGASLDRGELRRCASPSSGWVLAGEESLHFDAKVGVGKNA